MDGKRGLRLVTHSGSFHCDEVFGYAILLRALDPDVLAASTLVRTRDPAVIGQADIAWDVGATYDPARGRFDHHQKGAPVRPDGQPYSSAGLLWAAYGRAALCRMMGCEPGAPLAERVWRVVDEQVVRLVDLADNGRRPVPDHGDPDADRMARVAEGMTLPFLVDVLNLPWDAEVADRPAAEDARFLEAVGHVGSFLDGRVDHIRSQVAAYDAVVTAHAASADPRVLELPKGMPWHGPAFEADLPVLFAVYPDKGGDAWMVNCMPPEPGSFGQRLPLPEAWAGLRDGALAAVSGIPDAVFCHLNRFICGARSREGALAMAGAAIALGHAPAGPAPRAPQ